MKGNSIIVLLVVLLLIIGVMIFALSMLNNLKQEVPSGNGATTDNGYDDTIDDGDDNTADGTIDGGGDNSGDGTVDDGGDNTMDDTVDISGFTMVPSFELVLKDSFEASGMKARVYITDSIRRARAADPEKYVVKTLFFPEDFLLKIGYVAGQEDFDFWAALVATDLNPFVFTHDKYYEDESGAYYCEGTMFNLTPSLVNRSMCAISLLVTNDSFDSTFQYASFPIGEDLFTMSMNMAQLAAQEAYDRMTGISSDSENVEVLRSILDYSADISAGLDPSLENSTTGYEISTELSKTFLLNVGESVDINASYSPSFYGLPIYYVNVDNNVISVVDDKITALSAGTTMLMVGVGLIFSTYTIVVQ